MRHIASRVAAPSSRTWDQALFLQHLHRLYSTKFDSTAFLSKPSWSVRSLLPDAKTIREEDKIKPETLHHLLRLSALPLPATPEEQGEMLDMLNSQLHFVRQMQRVDTTGIQPLQSLRDESAAAAQETTITIETLKDEFASEVVVGRNKKIRRVTDHEPAEQQSWDVLGLARKRIGRYFVVESGKSKST